MSNDKYIILSRSKNLPIGGCSEWHIFGEASSANGALEVAMSAKAINGNYGIYRAVEMKVIEAEQEKPALPSAHEIANILETIRLANILKGENDESLI